MFIIASILVCVVRSLKRSMNIPVFAVVRAIGFHPYAFFVASSHWIFLSFDVKYINFLSYRSIAEEIFFALALTRVGGRFHIALATVEVIALVMAAMNTSSAVIGIMGVVPLFARLFPYYVVVIVAGAMIQPSW